MTTAQPSNRHTTDALAELLDAERQSLLQRVAESDPFITDDQQRLAEVIQQMALQQERHIADLGRMILELGGSPEPPAVRLDLYSQTAHMHYLRLDYLLPNLLDDVNRLLEHYRRLAEQLAPDSPAGQLVRRLRQSWQDHLEALEHHAPAAGRPD
jgi:hypothetical protein